MWEGGERTEERDGESRSVGGRRERKERGMMRAEEEV